MEGLTSEKRIEMLKLLLAKFDKKNDTEKFAILLTVGFNSCARLQATY